MHRLHASRSLAPLAMLAAMGLGMAPGCGGAAGSDLLSPGGSSAGPDAAPGDDAATTPGDSGAPVDSGKPPVDSGHVDSSSGHDGDGPVDSSVDADATPTGPEVLCPVKGNPQKCPGGDVCCIVGTIAQNDQTDTCEASASSCGGTPVSCASSADCTGGDVCCGVEKMTGGVYAYVQVSCAPTCNGTDKVEFCSPTSAHCPAATPTCGQSQLLRGFTVCQ